MVVSQDQKSFILLSVACALIISLSIGFIFYPNGLIHSQKNTITESISINQQINYNYNNNGILKYSTIEEANKIDVTPLKERVDNNLQIKNLYFRGLK